MGMSIPGVEVARRRRASHGRTHAPLVLPPPPPKTLDHASQHPIRHRLRNVLPLARSQPDSVTPKQSSATQAPSVLALPRETILSSRTSLSKTGQSQRDDLHGLALAARNRLDEKLRASDPVCRRQNSFPSSGSVLSNWHERTVSSEDEIVQRNTREWLATGALNLRKQTSGLRSGKESRPRMERFLPMDKTIGNDCDQDDCPVCLDRFLLGHTVMCLPCEHRFHSDCVIPWLESHSTCPFCRANVPDQFVLKSRSIYRKPGA